MSYRRSLLAICVYLIHGLVLAQTPAPAGSPPPSAAPTPAVTPPVTSAAPSGQSTDLSAAFEATHDKPYQYKPTDPTFWAGLQKNLDEGNPVAALVEGAKQMDRFGESSPDGAEGKLGLAMGLRAKGFHYAAFLLLMDLAKGRSGTAAGEAALFQLGQLAQGPIFDEKALENFLNSNEFAKLHPEVQSFVSYFRYRYNLRFGFNRWAQSQKKMIRPESFWDYSNRYWTAVGELARNRVDTAEASFVELEKDTKTPARLKQEVGLQLARLAFERGQFDEAHKRYLALGEVAVREKGRVLLEIAWTKFYMKDYAKALGLLKALQAPYFRPSLSPERHILEMVLYREVCHYEAVDSAVQRFHADFKESIRAIKKRLPLRDDPVLLQMALLNRDIQGKANLIDQLRREHEEFSQYSWKEFTFYAPLVDEYVNRDKTLQKEIDIEIEPRVRELAENLLDAEEQVQFLDYTSKLDSLRIVRAGEERDYKSQIVSYLTFEHIYWTVENEYWWDEFDDFNVLISSQCNRTTSPADEKLEREFE